ncbi:MAG: hypothetical protein K0R99_436 [Microbacterium sp.]|jgi:hypothetical protein|uniref:hypothetical protein n=1 Tax=Microbacterium sp. TaxID=51671 RepID=UPI002613D586|nr:hypothetical protein [Microbacterium sp.]MDF2558990.1 hypothetical protein [Microbacterium sp.]
MQDLPPRHLTAPWVLRFVQDRHHRDGIHLDADSAWEFRVLGGLVERVRRAAKAYLLLESKGFAAEGRVIVRSALEHAVTAQWAYLTLGGIDRLEVSLLSKRHEYARSARPGDEDWDHLLDDLEQRIPRHPDDPMRRAAALPKFTGEGGVLSDLDTTGYLKRAFVVLSRVNHVSDEAVTDYFVEIEDQTYVADSPASLFDDDVFHTLATACCLASWLMARLEKNEHEIRAARSQHLLWRLDTNLSPQRRRFPAETE